MKKSGGGIKRFYQTVSTIYTQGEIIQGAIIIAYYVLFSIFPVIMIVGNILPLFHIDTAPIAEYLNLILPEQISHYIIPIINSLLKNKSTGYISFGIVTALWTFSNLVNAIRIGMNRIYDVHKVELNLSLLSFLWNRGVTILLTGVILMLFTVFSLALIFGQQILGLLRPIFGFSLGKMVTLFNYKYPVLLTLITLLVAYLNYALPNIDLRKRVIWPGVITTVLGWIALSFGFSFYLHNFRISWENYGIVGTFIIFMMWLHLTALLLLFGTCVNATIVRMRYGQVNFSSGRVASYIQQRRRSTK